MFRPLATVFNKLFRMQQWYVGWARAPLQRFIDDPASIEFTWIIPRDKRVFIADPFGVEAPDGHLIILAEKLVQGRSHGEIVRIDTRDPDASSWVPLLRKPWHLSYPYIVQDGARRFVVPEQGASGTVSAYPLNERLEIDPTPSWTLPDCPALDSSPFFHDGRWWMFSARRGQPHWGGPLLLHHAPALEGPWTAHPMNPVVTDYGRARPGGRVISSEGRLLRPAQDCARVYGEGSVIHEILELTPTRYAERTLRRISPQDLRAPQGVGCHHLDHTGSHVLVDAMRFVWHPLAWWYKWRS